MLPAKMGDGTLYTDDELRSMTQATTRVRFQLRRDDAGELQIYGIHSKASGDDSVRTVQARWNADKIAMEAHLNGVTILMTPRRGRYGTLEPLVYPENSDARLGTILVRSPTTPTASSKASPATTSPPKTASWCSRLSRGYGRCMWYMRGRLMGIMGIIRPHWDFRLSPML
jgi:hypothetical protein